MAKPNYRALSLSDVPPQLPESVTYQAKLRAAAASAVTAEDVTAITQGIVQRAKNGDRHAIAQLFGVVLGGNQPTHIHATQINQVGGESELLDRAYSIVSRSQPLRVSDLADVLQIKPVAAERLVRDCDWFSIDGRGEAARVSIAMAS